MEEIEEIYKEYSKVVYKYLCCITNNSDIAEELTQETFYIAVREISNFRKECKVEVWLCQIAKFLWYKEEKKKKRIVNFYLHEDVDKNDELENLEKTEEKQRLYSALEQLNENTKRVITLRISAELSFKQIGLIFNKSENWARVTFYRGKEKLKEILKNEN